jgi:hypothetical protein
VNDLTNRELIRQKFKFNTFTVNDNDDHSHIHSDDEDDLLESQAFIGNNNGLSHKKGGKDLTDLALVK